MSQNSIFSLAAESQRFLQSKSSSEFDGEENEPVHPLGGSYIPQGGNFIGTRKFEFHHMQREKQKIRQQLGESLSVTEFEEIIREANELMKTRQDRQRVSTQKDKGPVFENSGK